MLDQLEFVKSLLIISNFVLLFAIVVCSRRQSKFSTTLNDQIQRESVAIVIAHPDDEAMFFTPTINTLVDSQTTNNKQRYDVHIICLSNGNFKGLFSSLSQYWVYCFCIFIIYFFKKNKKHTQGLGKIREKELIQSCLSFGIPENNCHIINHKELQDGSKKPWSSTIIVEQLKPIIKSIEATYVNEMVFCEKKKKFEKFLLNQIITFDENGISSHQDHIATCKGVR